MYLKETHTCTESSRAKRRRLVPGTCVHVHMVGVEGGKNEQIDIIFVFVANQSTLDPS